MTGFARDVAYAFRTFRARPGFAITAIATLALGIGAASALFSVVNAVLLRPLPYAEPARLVHIWEDMRNRNVTDFPWPPADFADLRAQTSTFEGVAALTTGRQVIVSAGVDGQTELIRTGAGTPNLFRLLGVNMALGSDFTEADGVPPPPVANAPGAPAAPVVQAPPPRTILSHEFWQRRFGANPAIVGTVVHLGDQSFDVAGVLAPGVELLFPPGTGVERVPDLWTPLRIDFTAGSRINVFLRVIARLKPGVPIGDAQADVDTLAADLRSRFPIKQTAGVYLRVEPMQKDLVADVREGILALMGAVTFLLLIACANVANLLLIRAAARERELAVRAALGGTRWRLVRQLLAESVILAFCALLLGLGLAQIGIRLLAALGPAGLPRLDEVTIDPTVVAFAAVAGFASTLIFGLVPAWRSSRPQVMDVLRKSGRSSGLASGRRLRTAVVVTEVALSFALLVGSGLMIRSFVALQRVQPGFDPSRLLTFFIPNLRLPEADARRAFMRNLQERLSAMPGVVAVTAASPLPLDGRTQNARWGTEAALADPSRFQQATTYFVTPGYFEAMRTRVLEGRTFSAEDNRPEARVLVIDRILAAKAFPGQSAVGRTLVARLTTPDPQRFTVIGVVDHQRHDSLAADGREGMYAPDGYAGFGAANRWAVRTTGDPEALSNAVRAAVTELNPRAAAIDVQPMQALVDQARAQTTFALALIGVFAAIALVLVAVGLYSILSTTVRQRTAEIGVRMALGAGHFSIFRMMVVYGLWLSVIGIGLGLLAAIALTGMMRSMLIGVEPTDPATFVVMTLGFLTIAALACGGPALRAARMNPVAALRQE